MKNTRVDIQAAYTSVAAALTTKNRTSAASAVAAAAGYDGNDRNNIAALATAAGVSPSNIGSDDVYLANVIAAVNALTTI